VFASTTTSWYYKSNFDKPIQHDGKRPGKEWMNELLNGRPKRIRDNLGVSMEAFLYLEDYYNERQHSSLYSNLS
jgi:hypothetical protein